MAPGQQTTSLEIPPEYVAYLRYSALKEIGDEAQILKKEAVRVGDELEEEAFHLRHEAGKAEPLDWRMSDFNGTRHHVQEALDVTEKLFEEESPGVLHGTAAGLAFLLSSFVEYIAEHRPDYYGPMEGDGGGINPLATTLAALQWAGDETARLEVLYLAERNTARDEKGDED